MENPFKRACSPELDAILGKKIYTLGDGIGYVMPVDYMGNDCTIANCARVSYAKGTKQIRDFKGLIKFLMRHSHSSPFEMCKIMFQMRIPLFAQRQVVRHRSGTTSADKIQNLNEESGRFSVLENEVYIPPVSRMCEQSSKNKQQSGNPLPPEVASSLREELEDKQKSLYEFYTHLLDSGLVRELSRTALSQSQYISCVFCMDAHNLMHFMKLRLGEEAQYEVKVYAEAMAETFKIWLPATYDAWVEYRRDSVMFSATEIKYVIAKMTGSSTEGILDGMSKGEEREFFDKLEQYGYHCG